MGTESSRQIKVYDDLIDFDESMEGDSLEIDEINSLIDNLTTSMNLLDETVDCLIW